MPNTVRPLTQRKEKEQLKRYRAALLKNPMTLAVVERTLEIAMDDSNPNQMAAIKLIMDRALPTRGFELERNNPHDGKGAIQINISGLGLPKEVQGETLEHSDSDRAERPDEDGY